MEITQEQPTMYDNFEADLLVNEMQKSQEEAIGAHFVMFDFAGVIVHLFIDAHVDGREEGRIIVKDDYVTAEYLTYSGEADKMGSMIQALETAAALLYSIKQEIK